MFQWTDVSDGDSSKQGGQEARGIAAAPAWDLWATCCFTGFSGHLRACPPTTPLEQRSCVCWACGCRVFGVLTTDFPTCGSCHLTILEGVARKEQVASPRQLLIPSPSYLVTRSGSSPFSPLESQCFDPRSSATLPWAVPC